ncbi:cytosolic carboxypeptidase-like protein 5 isoform X2 [Anneissia japonica]|uniref:cytosolic carboxypeptidase-like protein 5 isoform X2 n=1 Tax=Anneissia japonica TaxID=1529436 RepID=UPI001425B1F2|nr:cytosolic carboxypeptidase-like protein 5 isoform X2 [Anneissia japonica]
MECRSGGLLFTSKLDSGNLARVERVVNEDEDAAIISRIGDLTPVPDYEYNVWTSPDCEGTEFENGNRSWFHFAVKGGPMNKLLKINIMNMNRQGKLYNQGMAPMVKVLPQKPKWERIRERPTFESVDGQFILTFTYRFEYRFSSVYFAFCFPFSYTECQQKFEAIESQMNQQTVKNNTPDAIYYHRELLCHSIDKLRVDLVTITSHHGITNAREPRLMYLFPDSQTPRAHKFKKKRVFFLSSRVHPGETPASFVFNGFLDFILRPNDPRAIQLRKQYVFKLIPLLNPDGVMRGHYRTDQRGVNLNRVYLNPDFEMHPSIFATKSVFLHHHVNSRLCKSNVSVSNNEGLCESKNIEKPKNSQQTTQLDQPVIDGPNAILFVHNEETTISTNETDENKRPVTNPIPAFELELPQSIDQPVTGQSVSLSVLHDVRSEDTFQLHTLEYSDELGSLAEPTVSNDSNLSDIQQRTEIIQEDSINTSTNNKIDETSALSIPPSESGIAFYVDLHGHASKRGCFIYGNHFEEEEKQVENLLFPKLISMNSAHFDFDGCNFSEKNMYTKDKRDGMTKEGSGRVAMFKATGIIHSYTLECNYNCGRFMNSIAPATMDNGRATPPPVAGFPPKFTISHYEEVGRAVAIAALDMTNTNPWSRLASTDYQSVHGMRTWVQKYLRSSRGAPSLPKKMSRVISRTSGIVATAATTNHQERPKLTNAVQDSNQTAIGHGGNGQSKSTGSFTFTSVNQTRNSTGSFNYNNFKKGANVRTLAPVRDYRLMLDRKKVTNAITTSSSQGNAAETSNQPNCTNNNNSNQSDRKPVGGQFINNTLQSMTKSHQQKADHGPYRKIDVIDSNLGSLAFKQPNLSPGLRIPNVQRPIFTPSNRNLTRLDHPRSDPPKRRYKKSTVCQKKRSASLSPTRKMNLQRGTSEETDSETDKKLNKRRGRQHASDSFSDPTPSIGSRPFCKMATKSDKQVPRRPFYNEDIPVLRLSHRQPGYPLYGKYRTGLHSHKISYPCYTANNYIFHQ